MADKLDTTPMVLPPINDIASYEPNKIDNSAMEALARAALPTPSPSAPAQVTKPPTSTSRYAAGMPRTITCYRPLAPAPPPRITTEEPRALTIFDLPPELRIEIYKLVLENVVLHILPLRSNPARHCPHALIRTSRQVRNEVLPIIHSTCRIRANVTDFDFGGMLEWISRIPPSQQHHLCKNQGLQIMLCTTSVKPTNVGSDMRKWLHMRADPHRAQPAWRYTGAQAQRAVANDLRRRVKRMTEAGKRAELQRMLDAIKVQVL